MAIYQQAVSEEKGGFEHSRFQPGFLRGCNRTLQHPWRRAERYGHRHISEDYGGDDGARNKCFQ